MSSLIVEVCVIDNVEKHPNADNLEIATVKGWNCIIRTGQYREGDTVVFIPPDSVLSPALIEKHNITYLKNNSGRIGTIKLRGYISQGLILPAPEGCTVGQNVAGMLGITKWEPEEPRYHITSGSKRKSKSSNPNFDRYTDLENIKNFNNILKPGDPVVITEKIHGTNFRAGYIPIHVRNLWDRVRAWFYGGYEFVYGSRNVQLAGIARKKRGPYRGYYSQDVYGKIAEKYKLGEILDKDFIIYGEIYGKGIQDLTYGLDDIDLVVFDIKYKDKYLDHADMVAICQKLKLPTAPVLYIGEWDKDLHLRHTDGKSILAPHQIREGVVVRPTTEKNHPRLGRLILKSISTDYLLRPQGTEFK